MKSIIKLSAIIFFASFVAWGCGESTEKSSEDGETVEAHHGEGPEYNSAYVCPMHCEGSGSADAGSCPVCGMNYVKQSEHMEDGHHHEH